MTSECGDSFEVIVGTYEEFLLGYKFQKVGQEYKFVQSIAEHSHKSSVRAVTMHNHLLASGGADETIHLYDLVSRKETGVLMQHSGTVNCLKFTPDGAFLVSCSEDGSLAIFRVGNWVLEKVWPKAHKGEGVNSVSVHPSGKLALTVGNDSTLRTWNLVKGRRAYATNIGRKSRKPECVHWSGGEGSYYGVPYDTKLDIYSVQTAGVVHSIQLSSKVSCFTFINVREHISLDRYSLWSTRVIIESIFIRFLGQVSLSLV
ncbi:hypothetical protein AAG570_013918 [Ranatra chinensis]|uniref:P21-activated protein kinase-interacting protein 1-like n=1 Tax=Ranatra chinensis TaxID=642074 RepID=A0ABD0YDJ6_9HEMI